MTHDEIVNALKCCSRADAQCIGCDDCPFEYCGPERNALCKNAHDLIESLQAQLAASQRRVDAAVEDLHGYCKACINAPKTLAYDDLIKPICRECNKVVRQNWQWRGPQEAGKGEEGK